MSLLASFASAFLLPLAAPSAAPQEGGDAAASDIEWQAGPCDAALGERATLKVPDGFHFTSGAGTRVLMELMENPTSGRELGLVMAPGGEEGPEFFVVFEFADAGYIEDKDRDELDADALLASMKEGNQAGNEERRRRGWGTVDLVGWKKPPFYDPKTNDLTWATLLKSDGGETVNWTSRRLGRRGYMQVDLVVGPEALDEALPHFEEIMGAFEFVDGERYAQFTAGDKVAEYGLAALVLGGGAAVAAKTGLLAKFWKFIVVGLVAIAAVGRRFWNWVRGRETAREPAGGTD